MYSQSIFQAATIFGLLAFSADAHMKIKSPVPYGGNSLNNSPLENDGSDFPCKQRPGVYDITEMNMMPVGVPQQLSFIGGATHGGGSCQVSVTLDKEPTKDSEWKVIHSIIGGCPSNFTGNLEEDATGEKAAVFDFSMPKGMPNGQYTLAWTWFNKIGNREMYMNCAPITVTGGADNNDVYKTLPTMFVINIPREQCATKEMEDFVFPDPGQYVETAMQTALGSATTGSGCASMTVMGAGSGSPGSAAAPTYAATSALNAPPSYNSGAGLGPNSVEPTAVQNLPDQAVPTYSGVVKGLDDVVTKTQLATITATGYAPAATSSSEMDSTPAEYAADQTNGTTSSGGCSGGAVSCNSPGSVVCIGSSQWGLCNIDNCAVPQELAAGTSCSGGVVAKRAVSHLLRHVHHAKSF